MIEATDRASHEGDVRRIEVDLAEVAGILNAAHGRLVELAADVIERELWRGHGVKSVEHWLCWRAGLSPQRARQIAAIARRRTELPATVSRLSRGELSVEQVGEVARYVPAHNEAEVASHARFSTVSQLRSTLSRYPFAHVDSASDAEEAEDAKSAEAAARKGKAAVVHDGDRFGLHVDAPLDDGAVIEQALLEAKDALFNAGQKDVTWMDALLEVCHRSLSTVESCPRRDRYRIYIHLDNDGGWLNQGPALPDSLLAKLCCDGTIQPIWETKGVPVSVGRAQRIVPDRTRRLVLDRDRTCIVPGCDSRYHLEVHHLIAWALGGRTDTCNLACLCPYHHDALHRGELFFTGNADDRSSLEFVDSLGRPMPPSGQPKPPVVTAGVPGFALAGEVPPYRHPPGERIDRRFIHFSRPATSEPIVTCKPNAPPT